LYSYYWDKIHNIDKQIEKLLTKFSEKNTHQVNRTDFKPKNKKGGSKNDPDFNVASYAYEMTDGVDLTEIPGVSLSTLLVFLTEIGVDLSVFPSAKHFVSWLGLAPNRKITGGKVMSSSTRKQTSPFAKMLRQAANSAGNSKTKLGDFFRRLAFRKGRMLAIIATARKIGVIIYNMLRSKQPYCYEYSTEDTQRAKTIKIKQIQKTLKNYNISKNDLKFATA
jgi:hypothetical protein